MESSPENKTEAVAIPYASSETGIGLKPLPQPLELCCKGAHEVWRTLRNHDILAILEDSRACVIEATIEERHTVDDAKFMVHVCLPIAIVAHRDALHLGKCNDVTALGCHLGVIADDTHSNSTLRSGFDFVGDFVAGDGEHAHV
eukprot:CAMPEP_0115843994 /NCGR_PEP_ID=MMETSP0287-20121206/8601_1 /TAXON_ID=412157 /ORGANISM="Chrysochromulina rotalis, Strain UIO044" /LENGTH=143 /DNA_ID=CAMNT_0003297709 /DNA_START=292 /DNA_END=723 /DNA_ORIENTATION=-